MSEREFAHWQIIRSAVDADVMNRTANLPEKIQDQILPFNAVCGDMVWGFIFHGSPPLRALRPGVGSLTTQGLHHVFGTLYLGYMGLQKENFQSLETWHVAMTIAETAYGVPEAKTDEWELFFVQHWGDNGKLMYRLHDEIAPLFGINDSSVEIAMVWIPLLSTIAKSIPSRRAAHVNLRSRKAAGKGGCLVVAAILVAIHLLYAIVSF